MDLAILHLYSLVSCEQNVLMHAAKHNESRMVGSDPGIPTERAGRVLSTESLSQAVHGDRSGNGPKLLD